MQMQATAFQRLLDTAVRMTVVLALVGLCVAMLRPFAAAMLWGAIIATAAFPSFARLRKALGGRSRTAAVLFSSGLLLAILLPVGLLSASLVDGARGLAHDLHTGSLRVPPPAEAVRGWPLLGKPLHGLWSMAATNLEGAVEQLQPHFKSAGRWLLAAAANLGMALVQLLLAVMVAGFLLRHAALMQRHADDLAKRLAGDHGDELVRLAGTTVRGVARGVVGVAFLQAVVAGAGMLALRVPGAGFWAFVTLLVAMVQLPTLLVLGPVAAYLFAVGRPTAGVVFAILALVISVSDNLLKPLLMGRGLGTPMLVILLGSIGGMLVMGVVGLFVGSVVMALGYRLFLAWLLRDTQAPNLVST